MDQNCKKLKKQSTTISKVILKQQIEQLKQQISVMRQKQNLCLEQKLTKDLEQYVMDIIRIKTSAKMRQINAINELQYLDEVIAQKQLLYSDFENKFEKKTKKYQKYKKQGKFSNKENVLIQRKHLNSNKIYESQINQYFLSYFVYVIQYSKSLQTKDLLNSIEIQKFTIQQLKMKQKAEEIKKLMSNEIQDFFERIQKVKIQEQTSQETCIICYNAQISIFGEPLPCGHVFHQECIKAWIKFQNKCPYCKSKVV